MGFSSTADSFQNHGPNGGDTEDESGRNCNDDETRDLPETLAPSGVQADIFPRPVEIAPREGAAAAASRGNLKHEVSVRPKHGKPANTARATLDAQDNLVAAIVRVKAEPVGVGVSDSAGNSPPNVDASHDLDHLRRENEVLQKEKAELEKRLKRSDKELKESKDKCGSLQHRLQASEAATEAAKKQVQHLEAKVSKSGIV